MNMKKSAIAIAVTGAIAFPMAAAADATVYGRVDIGIQSVVDDDGNTGNWIFNNFNSNSNGNVAADEQNLQMTNGNQSRVGVTASEDIGGGWTAGATMEFEADVLADGGFVGTRLGHVQFSNGPHEITVGKQWQPAYEYMGWNQGRLPTHGYYNYFQTFALLGDATTGATGYRQESSIGYKFGGGGYSDDPFTFDVLLGVNNGDGNAAAGREGNQAAISSIQVFAAGTFGPGITINGGIVQDFRDFDTRREQEPFLASIGARIPIGDLLEIGTSVYNVDTDASGSDDSYTSGALTAFWSFGGGWSAQTGVSIVDADDNVVQANEVETFNFGITNQMTSRTSIRLVGEFASEEDTSAGGTLDTSGAGLVQLGLQHKF